MRFEIKIGEVELISSDDNLIRKVVVMSDSIDTNLRERSAGVLCRVEIAFAIKNETKGWAQKLLEWSLKTQEDLYREVSIVVKASDGEKTVEPIRTINIPRMFCEDCYESYEFGAQSSTSSQAEGLFTIKMIQRGGNFSSIQNGN